MGNWPSSRSSNCNNHNPTSISPNCFGWPSRCARFTDENGRRVSAGVREADIVQAPASVAAKEAELAADTQRQLAEQLRLRQLEKDQQEKDSAEAVNDLRRAEETLVASHAIITRDLGETKSPYGAYTRDQLKELQKTDPDAWANELTARSTRARKTAIEQFLKADYGTSTVTPKRRREIEGMVYGTGPTAAFEEDVRATQRRRVAGYGEPTVTSESERARRAREEELSRQEASVGARKTAATQARQAGERVATEAGTSAAATRAEATATGESAAALTVKSTKKTYLALSPLDSGAMKPPTSIQEDPDVRARLDKNTELLQDATIDGAGKSWHSTKAEFKAFVDQSTDRKELQNVLHRLRPLLTQGGHTATGKRLNRELRSRMVQLNARLSKVIAGHFTRSVTSGLKRGQPVDPGTKRTRARPKKKPKFPKGRGPGSKRAKTATTSSKAVTTGQQPQVASEFAKYTT